MRPPRRLSTRLLALAISACLLPDAPASAQDTLVVEGRLVGAIGNFGADLGAPPPQAFSPMAGGGRFSVDGLAIVDRRTGRTVVMDPGSYLLDVDPVRPRVFVRSPGVLFSAVSEVDATTGAVRALTLVGAAQVPTGSAMRYAYSANRLYLDMSSTLFGSVSGPAAREVQVFDGTTGARLPGGFTFTALPLSPWLVTPEGDYAYVVEGASLVTIDLATGARRTLSEPATGLRWDPLNERLFVSVGGTLFVLNRQGDVLGSAAMGDCYGTAVSPHTGRLYVRRSIYYSYAPFDDLRVFDSRTYALLGQVLMPRGSGCTTTVFSAPGPPRQVGAVANANSVSLSWVNVGAASQFVLDVGLAPGRTDFSLFLGPENRASFAGVPSGIYYLRVRGGNEVGGGRASDELRLVVP